MIEQGQPLGVDFEVAEKIEIRGDGTLDYLDDDLAPHRRLIRAVQASDRPGAQVLT